MSWKQVLVCSKSKDFLTVVQDLLGDLHYSLRLVRGSEEIASLEPSYKPVVLVIDCDENSERKVQEIVLSFWKNNANLQVALAYRKSFSVEALEKVYQKPNVVYFQNPYENEVLLDWILQIAPVDTPKGKLKFEHLYSVRIADIGAKEKLDFDLYYYMPSNKKFLLYRRKNSEMTEQQMSKLQNSKVRDLYVHKSDISKLHAYLAGRLRAAARDKSVSDGQRRKNLKHEAKEVFRTILGSKKTGPTESRLALESCKKVALQFIQETSEKPDLYQKLMELAAVSHSNYGHAINVSIYATLFAMVLEEKHLEAASVGGLLHDIGMASLEKELDERDADQMTEEDFAILQKHPEAGVNLLKQKKFINDMEIQSVIAAHHEHMDGTGYPAGLKGPQISSVARICAIADEFDHLTSVRFNEKTLSPNEAIDKMIAENFEPMRFDPDMLDQIKMTFMSPPLALVKDDHVHQLKKPTGSDAQPPAAEAPQFAATADTKRRRRVKTGMKY